jgi:hypothetical protein
MGCFSTRCALTNLQFKEGDPVILVPLVPNHSEIYLAPCYSYDKWRVDCLPMFGTYDGYGNAENISGDSYDINVSMLSNAEGFTPEIWSGNEWSRQRYGKYGTQSKYVKTHPLDEEGEKQGHALVNPDAWKKVIEMGSFIHESFSLVEYLKTDDAQKAIDAREKYETELDKEKQKELFDIFYCSKHPVKRDTNFSISNFEIRMRFPELPIEEQQKVAKLYDETQIVTNFMSYKGLYWQPTFSLGSQDRYGQVDEEIKWLTFKLKLLKEQKKKDKANRDY